MRNIEEHFSTATKTQKEFHLKKVKKKNIASALTFASEICSTRFKIHLCSFLSSSYLLCFSCNGTTSSRTCSGLFGAGRCNRVVGVALQVVVALALLQESSLFFLRVSSVSRRCGYDCRRKSNNENSFFPNKLWTFVLFANTIGKF